MSEKLERVTITIGRDLLDEVDAMVDGTGVKSRSHAVDLLLQKALRGGGVRQAVILAGGTRHVLFMPDGKLKALVEDANGRTVIEKIIFHLKNAGVDHFILILGSEGEKIVGKLKNGADYGVKIEYVWEREPSGSAGALLLARSHLKETFLLSYSDVLYEGLDVKDLLKFHRAQTGAGCTLALTSVKRPSDYGVATLTGNRITQFSEKPGAKTAHAASGDSESHLINAGLAVCEPSVLTHLKKTPASFERDLLPALAEKDKLYGYVYSGPWTDVGSAHATHKK